MTEVFDRIAVESVKCGGRPCIRGMRIRDILVVISDGGWEEKDAVTEPGHLSSIGTSVVPSFLVLTRAEWRERERKRAPIWRTIARDGVAVQ